MKFQVTFSRNTEVLCDPGEPFKCELVFGYVLHSGGIRFRVFLPIQLVKIKNPNVCALWPFAFTKLAVSHPSYFVFH